MSIGEAILSEAFEAMGWPIPQIKRVAALLLVVSMLVFPVTFRHALMAYAEREAKVILHRLQPLLLAPTPVPSQPAK